MANSPDFIAHVLDMMRPAGRVSARAMFGAHGVYLDGVIVGIVDDDVLYLKTDAQSRPALVLHDLLPFRYAKSTGEVEVTSYYRAPDEALESPTAMGEWLRAAHGAALRSTKAKSARRPRRK